MATSEVLRSLDIRQSVRSLGELKALQERLPLGSVSAGICGYVSYPIKHLFTSWAQFSGSTLYPVPNPYGGKPGHAFCDAKGYEAMWGDNPYGNLRRDLLTHCINTLEQELLNLHNLLCALQEVHKAPALNRGICYQPQVSNSGRGHLKALMAGWVHYTGRAAYPIPSPTNDFDQELAFIRLPKWEGAYGDQRRDLLVYCIDQLKTGLGSYRP